MLKNFHLIMANISDRLTIHLVSNKFNHRHPLISISEEVPPPTIHFSYVFITRHSSPIPHTDTSINLSPPSAEYRSLFTTRKSETWFVAVVHLSGLMQFRCFSQHSFSCGVFFRSSFFLLQLRSYLRQLCFFPDLFPPGWCVWVARCNEVSVSLGEDRRDRNYYRVLCGVCFVEIYGFFVERLWRFGMKIGLWEESGIGYFWNGASLNKMLRSYTVIVKFCLIHWSSLTRYLQFSKKRTWF